MTVNYNSKDLEIFIYQYILTASQLIGHKIGKKPSLRLFWHNRNRIQILIHGAECYGYRQQSYKQVMKKVGKLGGHTWSREWAQGPAPRPPADTDPSPSSSSHGSATQQIKPVLRIRILLSSRKYGKKNFNSYCFVTSL